MIDNLKNKKVLFCYHTHMHYMAPPIFSEQQVICGPFIKNGIGPNGWPLLDASPFDVKNSQYNIVEVVKHLPDHQKPDVLIVRADSFKANFPRNIGQLGIPSVLILGDTQHGLETDYFSPIRTLLNYAQSEPFDLYVSDHTRHHMHFFIEAGLKNVHWLPALGVKDWGLAPQPNRTHALSFIGGTKCHPSRLRSLAALTEAGLLTAQGTLLQQQAAKEMNHSLMTFNKSLNGDVNLRTFEAGFAGTCLLTDALRRQSGLDLLFQDGKHLITYDSDASLIEAARELMDNPLRAVQIGIAAHTETWRSHHPLLKTQQLSDMLYRGEMPPHFRGDAEKRGRYDPTYPLASLLQRIECYELLQEWHRQSESLSVLAMPESDPRLAQDLVDLPRLSVFWRAAQAPALFAETEVADQIQLTPQKPGADVSIALLGSPGDLDQLGESLPPFLLMTNGTSEQMKDALAQRGYSIRHQAYPTLYCRGQDSPAFTKSTSPQPAQA